MSATGKSLIFFFFNDLAQNDRVCFSFIFKLQEALFSLFFVLFPLFLSAVPYYLRICKASPHASCLTPKRGYPSNASCLSWVIPPTPRHASCISRSKVRRSLTPTTAQSALQRILPFACKKQYTVVILIPRTSRFKSLKSFFESTQTSHQTHIKVSSSQSSYSKLIISDSFQPLG